MRNRQLAVILIVIFIVGSAYRIDITGSLFSGASRSNTLSTRNEAFSLHTCGPAQEIFTGPLTPSLDTLDRESDLSEVAVDVLLPGSTLSIRAGFGVSMATNPGYWARKLGSGWYIDWQVQSDAPIVRLEHWQMVRVHEDCIFPSIEDIQQAARQNPGQVWIIGNEPDVIWQDKVTAARYAFLYHDLYLLIKSSDPAAKIAVGGISQGTPLRLRYLDKVIETYENLYHAHMPVDWWTVHGYVLREEKGSWGVDIPPGIEGLEGELREISDHGNVDMFEEQIRSFRQWMAENGYRNTPLALTEFGILMPDSYGFPANFVQNYLETTFTWLYQVQDEGIGYPDDEYHLVQKWAWFSIADPTYSSSDLGDLSSGELTLLGKKFHDVILSMEP